MKGVKIDRKLTDKLLGCYCSVLPCVKVGLVLMYEMLFVYCAWVLLECVFDVIVTVLRCVKGGLFRLCDMFVMFYCYFYLIGLDLNNIVTLVGDG
jgi:hypothetical protein